MCLHKASLCKDCSMIDLPFHNGNEFLVVYFKVCLEPRCCYGDGLQRCFRGYWNYCPEEWCGPSTSYIFCVVLLAMINCLHCVSVSSGDFGSTDPAIFGAAIPITAVVSIRCLYNRSVLAVTPSGCILILCLNFMKSIRL